MNIVDTLKWTLFFLIATPLLIFFFALHAAYADSVVGNQGSGPGLSETQRTGSFKEHTGAGELERGEYEVIDLKGGLTRSYCPYTCADRGVEGKYCKTWKSVQNPELCYVQDTRLPSNAVQ